MSQDGALIHELDSSLYGLLQPFFAPLSHHAMVNAVLSGRHLGRVLVDDRAVPTAAFLTLWGNWCFLAGRPDHHGFNSALNRVLYDMSSAPRREPWLIFTCQPEGWGGQLSEVFSPRVPIPARRRCYAARGPHGAWRTALPAPYALERMDEALLSNRALEVPRGVREANARFRAAPGARLGDYGYVVRRRDRIVAWATVDCIVDGAGDVGVYTVDGHRRQGLATAAAAAALDHGFARGLLAANWTCSEDNLASIRTAEKLGLERQPDYTTHCLLFDPAQHRQAALTAASGLARKGEEAVRERDYRAATGLFSQAFALQEKPNPSDLHLAARSWAALGEIEQALAHLTSAADAGWDYHVHTLTCREFSALRNRPEWDAALHTILGNRRADPPGGSAPVVGT